MVHALRVKQNGRDSMCSFSKPYFLDRRRGGQSTYDQVSDDDNIRNPLVEVSDRLYPFHNLSYVTGSEIKSVSRTDDLIKSLVRRESEYKLKEELRESVIEISERKIRKEKKLLKEGKISDEEFVKFCDENTKGTAKKLKEEIEKIKSAENLTGNNLKIMWLSCGKLVIFFDIERVEPDQADTGTFIEIRLDNRVKY